MEKSDMKKLYFAMADVFNHVKGIMFTIKPNLTIEPWALLLVPSFIEKIQELLDKFDIFVATVKDFQLQISFEGLGVEDMEA